MVSISSDSGNGTGIVWDDQGHIVTAYHVVHGLEKVQVTSDGGKSFEATVVGHDRSSDLALLKVSEKFQPIPKGDSGSLRVGQFVLALANAYGTKASATSGIITGVKRNIGGWWGVQIEDAIVTDARVNPGYSGGPLVDANGTMVGLNVALVSSRGIAVPVDKVAQVVERVTSGKPVGRAYLGIVSNPVELPERVSRLQSAEQEYGLVVLSVEPGSPADAAGLMLGDVVLGFDGKTVRGFRDLTAALTSETIGRESKLRIVRAGELKELTVTPTVAPERD